MVYRASE